jgi:hypothetical protein
MVCHRLLPPHFQVLGGLETSAFIFRLESKWQVTAEDNIYTKKLRNVRCMVGCTKDVSEQV